MYQPMSNEMAPHLFALLVHCLEHRPIAPLAQLADDVKHLEIIIYRILFISI